MLFAAQSLQSPLPIQIQLPCTKTESPKPGLSERNHRILFSFELLFEFSEYPQSEFPCNVYQSLKIVGTGMNPNRSLASRPRSTPPAVLYFDSVTHTSALGLYSTPDYFHPEGLRLQSTLLSAALTKSTGIRLNVESGL